MAQISLGDMAQNFMLRRQTTSLKIAAQTAATELSTGKSERPSRRLKGDLTQFTGIESALTRLGGYDTAANDAANVASAMQSVFATLDRLTDGLGANFLNYATIGNESALAPAANDANQRFESAVSALNTRFGQETLFSGVATDGPAIAPPETILAALEAEITGSGAVTAPDIATVVANWFDAPTGFSSVAYLGGNPRSPVKVSADDSAQLSITANDPALRDTLKGLALASLVHRGLGNTETKVGLMREAGLVLQQSSGQRPLLAGRLGLEEERIEGAKANNDSERAALEFSKSALIAVDPYDAATRMEAAQNQLETLYSITARLSRLSLVDFLR